MDPELVLKHENGSIIMMMTKHVDDLKIAGTRKDITWVVDQLQKTFGTLKLEWNQFVNCGVQHIHTVAAHEITLDQEYIAALKPIVHEDLKQYRIEEKACETEEGPILPYALQQLYMSLLGAVAWVLQTRIDLAIFLSALQRQSGKAQAIHVKRLNAVVRYAQRHKRKLVYRRLKILQASSNKTQLRAIVDSAFRKEGDSGHAARGAVFLRCCDASLVKPISCHVHFIEYYCGKQRHVTRSTFSAELLAHNDGADHMMTLAQIFMNLQMVRVL